MNFIGYSVNGELKMSDYTAAHFRQDLKENPSARYEVERTTSESRNQRKFYHGAVLTLWAYLDGKDYKDSAVIDNMHDVAKREFNGEDFIVKGKIHRVGKSTKGELNEFVERVVDYLEGNYGIDRAKVLDTKLYKKFRDEIYMHGGFDTFIDYMLSLNLLSKVAGSDFIAPWRR